MKGEIKVNIQKAFVMKVLAYITVASIMCSTLFAIPKLEVHASSISMSGLTTEKLVDMCLTRSGKVANADIREDIEDQLRNILNGTATSYKEWLETNGLPNTTENFRTYLESDAYASLPMRFVKLPLELSSFIQWITTGSTWLDELGTDVDDILTETDSSGNITVPNETVYMINECFNGLQDSYSVGWRYEEVHAVSELPSHVFGTPQAYENAKLYISSSEYPVSFHIEKHRQDSYSLYFTSNNADYYYVLSKTENYGSYMDMTDYGYTWQIYDELWNEYDRSYQVQVNTSQFALTSKDDFEEMANAGYGLYGGYISLPYYEYGENEDLTKKNEYSVYAFYGKTSGKIKVYDSLDDVKKYYAGNTPYYLTNRQYSDSEDNSFNVSGEYLQNNGGNFSYEQIRDQINNSSATTDNSVNNIVNDYSQTIINNYYGSSSGGSDGGDGSGDGDSGGSGILDLLGGIGDLLDFILSLVGKVISILSGFLTGLLDLLSGLGGIFSGFSGLLGELFGFIPSEVIGLLTASIEAVIIIAVWKMVRGK